MHFVYVSFSFCHFPFSRLKPPWSTSTLWTDKLLTLHRVALPLPFFADYTTLNTDGDIFEFHSNVEFNYKNADMDQARLFALSAPLPTLNTNTDTLLDTTNTHHDCSAST